MRSHLPSEGHRINLYGPRTALITLAVAGGLALVSPRAMAAPTYHCGKDLTSGFNYASCTVYEDGGQAVGAHTYPSSTSNPDTTAGGVGYCDDSLGYGSANPYCTTASGTVNPTHADDRADVQACYGIYNDSICKHLP